MRPKFRLIKDDVIVGYMQLQPKCCETSNRLLWRYSENGETNWSGCGRDVIDFDTAEAYTGLKDKNDVEIYEGDICKNGDWEPDAHAFNYREEEVRYYPNEASFGGWNHNIDGMTCEVIGNIHKDKP